jgi:hypothetical protein
VVLYMDGSERQDRHDRQQTQNFLFRKKPLELVIALSILILSQESSRLFRLAALAVMAFS